MTNDKDSTIGARGDRFDAGEGPQLLAQFEASSPGAEVVGSDGKKVGDLKSVNDDDFVVERRMRRDLCVPVDHISEVTTDSRIVLDVPADRVDGMGWPNPSIG